MYKESTNEKTYTEHITCSKIDKKRLMEQCIPLYVEDNPQMEGMNITQGVIIKKVIDYFLR